MSLPPALRSLAEYFGVATEYQDWQGQRQQVSESTVKAVLTALGVDVSTAQATETSRAEVALQLWRRPLPPCVVTRSQVETDFFVHFPDGDSVQVTAVTENAQMPCPQLDDDTPPRMVDGILIRRARFAVPKGLDYGYHRLVVASSLARTEVPLIITPDWLGTPERLGDEAAWGLMAQLYSVRSRQSWGIGDAADLRDLAAWVGREHAADFVLVNPMHAAEPFPPVEPSPYLPTTRRFMSPLYLRIEDIPEFSALDAEMQAKLTASGADISTEQIDRNHVWRAKDRALRHIFELPLSPARDAEFAAFREREADDLVGFSTWCAIAAEHGSQSTTWPTELQDPRSTAVANYRATHTREVDYHAWLQWLLDDQLCAAQEAAGAAGMRLGVVHDLAVGVNPTGAEAWARGDVFAHGVSVGAPPDAFTQLGQNWSQPPWRPDRLAELAYEPFRSMVRALLRHAGGIRVDHVIGLFRLWWIPEGSSPADGTYVRYDHEALIGILALEAWLAGAVIVGEDLGTVEPWVRDYLAERGLLGTSILWFERDYEGDGEPRRPDSWREYCLASVTTHDLPPAAGYLEQAHVHLRHELGLIDDDLEAVLANDITEQEGWRRKLHQLGLIGSLHADTDEMLDGLHRFLALTPSRMRGVALVDAVGDRRVQNQPGTTDEYPNWRVPLSGPDGKAILLEDVYESPRFSAAARAVRGIR